MIVTSNNVVDACGARSVIALSVCGRLSNILRIWSREREREREKEKGKKELIECLIAVAVVRAGYMFLLVRLTGCFI